MNKLLTEDFVQEKIIDNLTNNGWSKSLKSKTLKEHGVDIKVRNDKFSRYFLIECKGDASPTAKYPRSHREVNFNLALGQIITRMQTTGTRAYKYRYKYGVGYPASFKDLVVRRLPYDVCDKLNLYVFFVDEYGAVEMLGWKDLKKVQTHIAK
ncbi:MAG TPA: hypothetical protein VE090_03390 [Methylomirabilota bacterium]|nr:hypothetical protein [Methylomirabilota bacterium]